MIESSRRDYFAFDQSRVLSRVLEVFGDDDRVTDGERSLFQDVRVERTDVDVTHVSLVAVQASGVGASAEQRISRL